MGLKNPYVRDPNDWMWTPGDDVFLLPNEDIKTIQELINPDADSLYCRIRWDKNNYDDYNKIPRDNLVSQFDPIALDLNNNGLEALAANGHNGALFDHERSGIRTGTGWVHSNDGILVYDRNGDGKINNGGELFGDNTLLKDGTTAAHGFAALAELDENGDGKVDAADSVFNKLGVWRDFNHNGISEEGEISSLEDVRVQSLNLAYKNTNQNLGNGNMLAEVGSYTDADGNEHIMGDLQLFADRFHSRFSDNIELTDAQRREVNLRGSGRLRDLREAAAQSSELAEVLRQYKNAETKEKQLALRDKLLQAWSNTDPQHSGKDFTMGTFTTISDAGGGARLTPSQYRHMQSISSIEFWDLIGSPDPNKRKQAELNRRIAILDAFTGTKSQNLYYADEKQAQHIVDTVNDTYDRLADSLYDGLLFQTRLRPYFSAVRYIEDNNGQFISDYSNVSALFAEIHKKNPGKAFTDLGELLAKGNADGKNTAMAPLAEQFVQFAAEAGQNGTFAQYADVLGKKNLEILGHRIGGDGNDSLSGNESANYLSGENGDDILNGYGGNDILNGGAGNDTLKGDNGDDTLNGGAGNDKLYGGNGHDTLVGGAGDDHMQGGDYESDTYLFAKGHGKDNVYDWARNDDEADKLVFKGVKAQDAVFGREGVDLTIRAYGSEQDQVNIQGFFTSPSSNQHHFQFDDATLKVSDIAQKTFEYDSTSGNGWITDDTIHGGTGNDSISGGDGNDTLNGNDGNDTLKGDNGDDTLNGGAGNDKLYGGNGHDTLVGGAGDDHMQGGDYESDTYLFAKGHGRDSVYDWSRGTTEADTLVFHGAKAKDAVFGRVGGDLTIRAYGNESDQVTVQSYYDRPGQNHYNLRFDDVTYDAANIHSRDLLKDGLPSASVAATEENPVPQTATDTAASAQTVKEAKAETVPATSVGTSSTEKAAVAQQATAADHDTTATAPAKALAAQAERAGQQDGAATTDSHPVTPTTSGTQSAATASDAKAAAQAQHLIEAMAAFDTRSATADNLATPPLQQPPLAAAAADSTVKPLLP